MSQVERIKAEVKKYIESARKAHTTITESNFAHLLSFIESLEKEQDVDFEKEIYNLYDGEYHDTEDVARHFYDLGCRHAAVLYDDMEKERQRRCENEPTIKGWVARDIHGTLRLYGNDAADGMGIRTGELPSPYKELTAEDEPIEVELTISRVIK